LRRFKITLKDHSGIDIGVVLAELIVVAETAAEAEMYTRRVFRWIHMSDFDMTTTEIPTTD
jgi:hypothetical protein